MNQETFNQGAIQIAQGNHHEGFLVLDKALEASMALPRQQQSLASSRFRASPILSNITSADDASLLFATPFLLEAEVTDPRAWIVVGFNMGLAFHREANLSRPKKSETTRRILLEKAFSLYDGALGLFDRASYTFTSEDLPDTSRCCLEHVQMALLNNQIEVLQELAQSSANTFSQETFGAHRAIVEYLKNRFRQSFADITGDTSCPAYRHLEKVCLSYCLSGAVTATAA